MWLLELRKWREQKFVEYLQNIYLTNFFKLKLQIVFYYSKSTND